MPDQHRDFFRNTGIALVLASAGALFAQLTSLRVFAATLCVFLGGAFSLRAMRPQWFLRVTYPPIRLDSQNVLQHDPPTSRVSPVAWFLALLSCVLASGTAAFVFRTYGGGYNSSSQPFISIIDIRKTVDDELAHWLDNPQVGKNGGDSGPGGGAVPHSSQRRLTAKTAFSLSLESELTAGAAAFPTYFIGFWVGHQTANGYILLPVTTLAYVRVTNLQPVRTMIKRLSASLRECSDHDRIDTLYGDVFQTFRKSDKFINPRIGTTITFPFAGTGGYGFAVQIQDADLAQAIKLNLPLLDRELSEHYLEPRDEVGGWVAFDSSCGPAPMTVTLEDVSGDPLFTYRVDRGDLMMTGDLAQRPITIEAVEDLSKAQVDYSYVMGGIIDKTKHK